MEEEALNLAGVTRGDTRQTVPEDEQLLALAREAMARSYSPYSHFKVGACLLAADGRVYLGANVENASYGLTNCAERTAVFHAVSDGAQEFAAIAIAAEHAAPWPCGACRQVLNEFSPAMRVLITWENGKTAQSTLRELLPNGFGPADLP
jgi:cytidine deaminase